MPTRAQIEERMRRDREALRRGGLDPHELAEFESSKAREMAGAERRRKPQPQLELPEGR